MAATTNTETTMNLSTNTSASTHGSTASVNAHGVAKIVEGRAAFSPVNGACRSFYSVSIRAYQPTAERELANTDITFYMNAEADAELMVAALRKAANELAREIRKNKAKGAEKLGDVLAERDGTR